MLFHQFLVGEVVGSNEFTQRIPEKVWIVSVIEPPLKLVEVSVKMFCADFVVSTHNGTLQEAPNVFDGVSMDIISNPFLFPVSDGLMPCVMVCYSPVGWPVVGVDGFGIGRGMLFNELVKGLSVPCMDDLEPHLAATLSYPDNDGLVPLIPMPDALSLAAYPRFIYLNDAPQLRGVGFSHGIADSLAEIPRGLVRDSDGSLDLIGRDTLFGLNHHVDREKPLPQGQVTIVKDGACRYRELVAA